MVVGSKVQFRKMLRYLIVGGVNTCFGLALYWLFTSYLSGKLPLAYEFASFASGVISISFSYITYKWFVFRTKENYFREWVRSYVVYGSSVFLNLILLPPLVWGLEILLKDPSAAPYWGGCILVGVTVVFSFLGHQHYTFSKVARDRRIP